MVMPLTFFCTTIQLWRLCRWLSSPKQFKLFNGINI
jgi:hypothetical protein